jgi:hypothetical protein
MIPDDLFDALACGARAAVHKAWNHAFSLKGSLPDEIDHLYAMTTVGIREIGVSWSPILSTAGIALRVTGVFCHQTPKAHYTHPIAGLKRPELGDLLVVHEHKTARPGGPDDISRRAVLVQAKMVDQGVPGGGKVDQYQEYLYEHWPDFELKGRGPGKAGFLPGQRNFRPGGLDTGRYGLIERDPHTHVMPPYFPFCCGLPWTYSEPRKPVRSAGGEDAGAFIANMLYDTSWMRGRTALIPAAPLALSTGTPNNHFDVTVEELLTLTANKTLRFKNKSYIKGIRGESVFACFQQSFGGESLLHGTGAGFAPSEIDFDGEGVPPEDLSEPDFEDGISIVLVETGLEGAPRLA